MRIASVGTVFPVHRHPQAVITQVLKDRMQDKLEIPGVMNRLHSNCCVAFRHIMMEKTRDGLPVHLLGSGYFTRSRLVEGIQLK